MELVDQFTLLNTYPVKQYRWENGFQAFLLSNPISPVAAFQTQYTVGSASERDDQRGLAHFFEHMMFRETATLADGDFDRIMSEIGGVGLNAYTSYDVTSYHVNVPTAHLGRVVALEADRMVNLRLSPDLIEKERGAVLGEMRMYRDMPSEEMWETVMAAAFPGHPYRHPIIGYMEQVAAYSNDDFARFYGEHYAPNRAVVLVAGGFDEAATLRLLDEAYGALPPGAPMPAAPPPDPPLAGPVAKDLTHDRISSENLSIATRTPGLTHPAAPALMLLSGLLVAGHSSPLHQRLVVEGLATHVSATLLDAEMMLSHPGLFIFDVALQQGVVAEAAEEAIDRELARILAEGIPADEMARARNQSRLAYLSSLRSNMSLARQVSGFAIACGEPRFGETLLAGLEAASAEQVLAALQEWVVDAPRVVVKQRPGNGRADA